MAFEEGIVSPDRIEELLGEVDTLIDDGHDLESAIECLSCTQEEYLEINSLIGMGAQYEYQSMNDIDETIMVDIPHNNGCRMQRLNEHLDENPQLDDKHCYHCAVDTARGFAGLW